VSVAWDGKTLNDWENSQLSYGSLMAIRNRRKTDKLHGYTIEVEGSPYNVGCGLPWAWHDWEGRCPK